MILFDKKLKQRIIDLEAKAAQYKEVENLLNRALYQYTNNASYIPDAKNQTYIDEGYKANIHVYSVVTAIIQRCTGLPFRHMNGDTEIVNSDLIKLFNKPNPDQTRDEFIESTMAWLLLTGNAYWYHIDAENGLNKGKIIEMYNLPAHVTEIQGGGFLQPIKSYKVNLGHGSYLPIPPEQVIHIKLFNPGFDTSGSHLYGQSPLQVAVKSFATTNEGYKALNKAFHNGSPAGILTGTDNTGLDYTQEQTQILMDKWQRQVGGSENVRRVLFNRNPLDFIEMGWSPIDMNILEYLNFGLKDICNIYHVPPYLFLTDAATLDNYKEARKAIYTDAVLPLFDRLMPVINAYIAPKYQNGSTVTYDTSEISELAIDVQNLATALSTSWWLTGNERRRMMGVEEHIDPMMNEILYPSNQAPLIDEASNTGI